MSEIRILDVADVQRLQSALDALAKRFESRQLSLSMLCTAYWHYHYADVHIGGLSLPV